MKVYRQINLYKGSLKYSKFKALNAEYVVFISFKGKQRGVILLVKPVQWHK
jgi:hypothetical protein